MCCFTAIGRSCFVLSFNGQRPFIVAHILLLAEGIALTRACSPTRVAMWVERSIFMLCAKRINMELVR